MKKHLKKIFFCILLLPAFLYSSGQQNNVWYFGAQAGISFAPDTLLPTPHYVLTNAMFAPEGCSSICDDNGKMLFYCNGASIYNKYNEIMLNGDNLMGHISAFQAALIVPQPNSPNIYYVFTADALEDNFENGYRYSVVDMTLDGGAGGVVTKNILINAPNSERLTAARHADGLNIWIITNDNNSNVFRSYLLTCNGLQPAVISTTGMVLDQYPIINIGGIKVSPDGKMLCQTHFPNSNATGVTTFFQLFDFDNATGIISNSRLIATPSSNYYASEFSPDSKLLYVTKADLPQVDQFDCTLGAAAAIEASQSTIAAGHTQCGIQLAPDGKIYLSYYKQFLSVINNPDIQGSGCGFQVDKIDLGKQFSSLNMPGFVNDMEVDVYNYFTADATANCSGAIQFTAYTKLPSPVTYEWDFGDGNTSGQQNPVHTYADPQKFYLAKLKMTSAGLCGFIQKSKWILPGTSFVRAGFSLASSCDSQYVRFTNTSLVYPADTPALYSWDFGDGNTSSDENPLHVYQNPGAYPVKFKIQVNACVADSETQLVTFDPLIVQVSPAQTIAEGQSVQIGVTGNADHYLWTPSTGLSNPSIANPMANPTDDITYVVNLSNDNGCTATDSVFIKVTHVTEIYIPSAFTPNHDGKNDLLKPIISVFYTLNYFTVYNRWGQVVFTTSQIGKGWDGKLDDRDLDTGVYIWILKATDRNKVVAKRKGTVMLIR